MASDISERDKRFVWHPFTQMQEWNDDDPLVIERASGSYLIDTNGREYLDGVASLWVNVHGHCRPEINAAIEAQLKKVAHTTLLGLASPPSVQLAERLVALAPGRLSKVFYSDSGSTAVEIALKQAFQYWQLRGRASKRRFIYLDQAYHGDTLGAVAVGGISVFHEVFGPLLPEGGALHLRAPSPQHGATPDERRERALAALEQLLVEEAESVAALILEPLMQGAAGMLAQPDGYLRGVAELCRKHEVLLIADEVATGFGRTGTMFACEQEGVEPDFLCVAKGLTGGYLPLAATLATDEVYRAFLGPRAAMKTFFHGHTYTGNPLACAAAIACLELFDTDGTLENVRARSAQLRAGLARLKDRLPWIREIRQRGLMCGIELGSPAGEALEPSSFTGARVCEAVRRHGVILRPLGDVVVLMPPLCISEAEMAQLVDATGKAIVDVLG